MFKTINFGDANALTFISLILTNSIVYRIIDALFHSFFHILNETYLCYLFSYHLILLFFKKPP
jgi:hypothetical protein